MSFWEKNRPPLRLQRSLLIGGLLASVATPSFAFFHNEPDIELGRTMYQETCASCHGANLEGQPNWRERGPDGKLPAPPHDMTGHTWHHPDEVLFRITRDGVAKAVGIPDYVSSMPAYGGTLSDAEIVAVLSWIKSRWSQDIQGHHDGINRQANQPSQP
mgnify:CR=1 FL=1